MKSLTRIENGSVVEKIFKQFSDAIINRELKPGDKIPTEVELIEKLGVGRNSIREAIKMLSALGIIEIRRGDGTYISKDIKPSYFDTFVYSLFLDQSSKSEILELRQTIDSDILELAAAKATNEDILQMEELLDEMKEVFEKGDYEEASILDLRFHSKLVDIARNPLLGRIAKGIYSLFFKSIESTLELYESREKKVISLHRNMVEILKTKKINEIPELIKLSLEGWKNFI